MLVAHFPRRIAFSGSHIRKLRAIQSSVRTILSQKNAKATFIGFAVILTFSLNSSVADCAADESATSNDAAKAVAAGSSASGSSTPPKDDAMSQLIKKVMPVVQELGISGVIGLCAGYSVKFYGKQSAIAIGVVFAGLQTLQYLGYIQINHKKVISDVEKVLDANGDGKIDEKDALLVWDKVKEVLAFGLPNAAGFASGFSLGVYYG